MTCRVPVGCANRDVVNLRNHPSWSAPGLNLPLVSRSADGFLDKSIASVGGCPPQMTTRFEFATPDPCLCDKGYCWDGVSSSFADCVVVPATNSVFAPRVIRAGCGCLCFSV